MKKLVMKRLVIPRASYRTDRVSKTRATQNSAGLFTGRTTGKGSDNTRVIRSKKFFDINKNRERDKGDIFEGGILGRTSSKGIPPKRILVVRHYRKGKFVKAHERNFK